VSEREREKEKREKRSKLNEVLFNSLSSKSRGMIKKKKKGVGTLLATLGKPI
jgi:hypothetical protein